ncbi:YckD family protein [Caldanaerobius polysaccharolyticus]|uniref:YckD family protein n=1 Tax=Caldanaerobius polysaccharolyticus TaxID=44256 RepID=UPI000479C02F|nr:YckD family protein [Caldanaerobius polysaccharolyticus]
MRRKKIMIVLAVIVALAVPFSVFAATSDTQAAKAVRGFLGIDTSKLTAQQKADVADFNQKLAALQKDFINKMVSDGAITKEQGDAAIKKIDDMLKKAQENGSILMFGMGRHGFKDEDFGWLGKIDTSKLTDQQKAALTAVYEKMANLQKDLINKLANEGLITKDQANAATKKIDNMLSSIQKNGFAKGIMAKGLGGFGHFILGGIDPSKLSQQQKDELTNYFKNMAELQKELVNKFVAYGLITKDKGSAITNKIDAMEKKIEQNGISNMLHKGFMKEKGSTSQSNSSNNTDYGSEI